MSSELGAVNNNLLFNAYYSKPDASIRFDEKTIASPSHIQPRKSSSKLANSVQPLITSVGLHILCVLLLFFIAGKSNSIMDDSAGKAGEDMSVIMVEFDSASLSAGESASVASQASSVQEQLNEDEQQPPTDSKPLLTTSESVNEFSIDIPDQTPVMIDEPTLIVPVEQPTVSEPTPEPPQIVKKSPPTPKKEKSVNTTNKKTAPNKTQSRQSTAGMGGETEQTRQGTSHAGNASQGANTANTNNFTALSRRVHYPQKATSLKIEGRVKIRFDITDKGTVTNIRVLSEDPVGVFAQSVVKDMAAWKYKTNESVANQTVSIVFKLNGSIRISS